ncbi:MAG TPA: hypothetical protein VFD32_16905 [Dehalococcoidia bacterium]|nr:hypothetical protein [Dehalococcoidia bacterium]
MPRVARLIAGAFAVALVLGGAGVRPPWAAAAPQQTVPSGAPGADEALISLLPYRLQAADLPSGYQILDHTAATPTSRAFDLGATLSDSQDALQELQRTGFLAGIEQVIGPNDNTPVRLFDYNAELYATDRQASAAFHDNLDVPPTSRLQSDNPPLGMQLGDESGAVHVVSTSASTGLQTAFEGIFWRRGRVVFGLLMVVYDRTETLDQAVPFAQAADRHAAALQPPALVPRATLPVVGSDPYQEEAMYALYGRLPGPDQSPFGFMAQARTIITNADLIIDAADPHAAYNRIVGEWKRVTEAERVYFTLQGDTGDVWHVRLALSADTAGAIANVLDPDHQPNSAVETYGLPQPLGETSRLYRESYALGDGLPRESWRAMWTRGRVVLTVYTTGPAGDFTAQQVNDFAQLVDATYQRGAVPDVLTTKTPDVPGLPVPAPNPPVPTAGDWSKD